MDSPIYMWVVYDRPRDCPDGFVIRRWTVTPNRVEPDKDLLCACRTVDEARRSLPPGLTRLEPNPEDDRAILEVWL